MTDPGKLTATNASLAIRNGELTPEALVSACLERIGQREAEVRAWEVIEQPLIDEQLAALEQVPETERGALHGIPVGIKDIYDTIDLPTAYGSPIYKGHQPTWDAAAVARLRAAGAIILGKTVTTEFAYWKAGKTRNPHDLSRTPGGSSSGSAAAVADFMVPFATGTQTVASTMRPAAFCGVAGFKPSAGRISTAGIKPLAGSLDTVGMFARRVCDLALIGGVMAGRKDWIEARTSDASPAIAMMRTPEWDQVSTESIADVEKAAEKVKRAGASLISGAAPASFFQLAEVQNVVLAFEVARDFSSEWRHHRSALSPQICELIEEGLALSPTAYESAQSSRAAAIASLDDLFAGADFLFAPSALGEAPLLEEGTGDPLMSRAWTLLGLPSINLPLGTGPTGLPLGLQIAARPGHDASLLAAAQWIEKRLA